MSNDIKEYRRKISDEEVRGQYILILKNALSFFPKVGNRFKLKVKEHNSEKQNVYDVVLESFERWSIGPSKPQYYYRIDARQFREIFSIHFGKKIIITKLSDDEYLLS